MEYNLEGRTLRFSEEIINLCKKVPQTIITNPIISQLIICKKECRETKYWLTLLEKIDENLLPQCRNLWQEAQELTLIFSQIAISTK